jgi:hypothetical protein
MIFAALVARPVLAIRQQEVQVIASDVVLCKIDDRHRQTLFTVVICRMFRNITNELGNLCGTA